MQILLSISRPDSPVAVWGVGHSHLIFAVRNQRGAWLLQRNRALPTRSLYQLVSFASHVILAMFASNKC